MHNQKLLLVLKHTTGKLEIFSNREGKELYCVCSKNGYTKQFLYNSYSEFGETEGKKRLESVKQNIILSEDLIITK